MLHLERHEQPLFYSSAVFSGHLLGRNSQGSVPTLQLYYSWATLVFFLL